MFELGETLESIEALGEESTALRGCAKRSGLHTYGDGLRTVALIGRAH